MFGLFPKYIMSLLIIMAVGLASFFIFSAKYGVKKENQIVVPVVKDVGAPSDVAIDKVGSTTTNEVSEKSESLPVVAQKNEKIVNRPLKYQPKIESSVVIPPITVPATPPVLESQQKSAEPIIPSVAPSTPLPELNENSILKAVVKIQCPTNDGLGKYIGSGFVLNKNTAVTAGHVVMESGSDTCDIIFPKDRKPVHYLRGKIRDLKEVKRRHDEEGIDLAIIDLPEIDSYPEAKNVFNEYPSIPYSICENPVILGDKLLHFGYPSNYADQNYLSELEGEALLYADIEGVKEQLSLDQTFTYKTPIFSFNSDESKMHPYMLSRVASFYGDSGGLAFNASQQCVLGPHRGGTIGKSSGENYSIFMMLGWEKIKRLLP